MTQVVKETIKINIRKNTNETSKGYGKFYGEVELNKTLSTRGLAKHIIDHGSTLDLGTIINVLTQLAQCLPELVSHGTPVKIDGLGTFMPTVETKKGGAGSVADFSVSEHVKGIHIRFYPEQTRLDNISSREYAQKCSLELNNVVELEKLTVDGKRKTVRTLTPVADWITRHASATNGEGGGE